ncbi:MAG: M55 family metallopeptidase [Lentisphaeria bacterium]|nr:M55 family metallopeptidase [Lentisphaeria bacterium]
MKIHIMTDLEGPSGTNGRSDGIGNKTVNLPVACQVLTEEVNACIEGLVAAGADQVVVWDGHGGSNSIDITRLHPAAELGTIGGDLYPVTFLDASYDAAIQIGAHAMQGVADGYMNHTFSSHSIANMWLNGERVGEIGMGIWKAAYFGVPTILVSGDDAACREARACLPEGVTTVSTKHSISRYTVINRHPAAVRADLRAAAEQALRRLAAFRAKPLPATFELTVQMMCPNTADVWEKRGAERLDHMTVRFRGADLVDVWSQHCGWAPGVHNRKFAISPALNRPWTGPGPA